MERTLKVKFMPVMAICVSVLLAIFVLSGCQQSQTTSSDGEVSNTTKTTLQIFAANSLSKAMDEAQKEYIADGHDDIEFADTQYKSSGELNEMLSAGTYADMLISASSASMDTAVTKNLVDESTRTDVFTNDLLMVTKTDSELENVTLEDIAAGKYSICVGDDSVPAGNYAAQALSTIGIYTPGTDDAGKTGKDISGKGGTYSDAIKVVTDTSVGNVCKHAESGDVDISFVYESDAYRFGGVKIVGRVSNDLHKSIIYPAALTADCKNKEATAAFLDWCKTSSIAQKIWQKWGFELVQVSVSKFQLFDI